MNRLLALIGVLALAGGVPTANATGSAQASASITQLSLTLIDLDPLDGIAPSFSFTSTGVYDNYGYTSASDFDGTTYGYDAADFGDASSGAWTPGSASAATTLASAAAALSGPGTIDGSALLAMGSASSPGGTSCLVSGPYQTCNQPYASFSAQVYAPYYAYAGGFTVSANTLVLIAAQAEVSADAQGGGLASTFDFDGAPYVYQYGNSAYASLSLQVSGPAASGSVGGSQSSNDSLYRSSYTYWDGTDWISYSYDGGATSGPLTVSFVNASGSEMAGYFQAGVYAYGYTYGDSVAAVPEPQTYAMMLAGLLSLGFLTRRRREV